MGRQGHLRMAVRILQHRHHCEGARGQELELLLLVLQELTAAMTAAEKKVVEKCVPKGGSFHNDMALMSACPKVEAASDGRLSEYPELLPGGIVQLELEELDAVDWPSTHLGVVGIQHMYRVSMKTKHVPTIGSFGLECLVCDCVMEDST